MSPAAHLATPFKESPKRELGSSCHEAVRCGGARVWKASKDGPSDLLSASASSLAGEVAARQGAEDVPPKGSRGATTPGCQVEDKRLIKLT